MTLLILEDEIPAYQKLLSHLKTFFDNDITNHWARSIVEGKALLASNSAPLTMIICFKPSIQTVLPTF